MLFTLGGSLVVTQIALSDITPCGVDDIDRLPIADYVTTVFGLAATPAIARCCVAIVYQESKGDPTQYLGDTGIASGPSVGPMQVLRTTAIDLGLVPKGETSAEYMARKSDEDWGLRAGCFVFRNKLDMAGGDLALALQYYNGSAAYRARALSWLRSTYGDDWENPT